MLRMAWGLLAGLPGFLLDLVTPYVPNVEPIVFDRERTEHWRQMVDAAEVSHQSTRR